MDDMIAGISADVLRERDPGGETFIRLLDAVERHATLESDALGQYEIPTLNPGPYLLRAHSRGYVAPRAQMIEVRSNARIASSFAMQRSDDRLQVLAAGIGPVLASESLTAEI